MSASLTYRIASALWAAVTVPYTVLSVRRARQRSKKSRVSATSSAWDALLFATSFLVGALQIANAAVLGLFWPVFAAFFYHLFAAADVFFRLMFRDQR